MARNFNGTSDLIDCGTGVNANTSTITISAWVKPSALSNAYSTIVSRNGGGAFYQIFVKSTGKLAVYMAGVSFDPGTITLSVGTWYNVVGVSTNTGNLVGYVNGAVDSTVGSAGSISVAGVAFQISNDAMNAGRNFAGSIADVTQWNVVLTPAEITALSKGARPYTIRPLSLDGYWPLDGLQSPEPDLSGNHHNGTLTGTALASGPPVMMFTPRQPQFTPAAAAASSVVFRRSLSPVGTRTGARQAVA